MVETNYIFSISEDTQDGKVETSRLSTEISSSSISVQLSHINTNGDELDIYFVDVLDTTDQATLATVVSTHEVLLFEVKEAKINEIRAKTEEEEGKGVPYNDYHFSITASAKSNWLAIVVGSASLTYPFSAPTGFNEIYEFQDQTDVSNFFGSSIVFLKYWEESNESLIIAVNNCTTEAEVEAIVDNRTYPPN